MNITDEKMRAKFERALRMSGDLYTFDDIMDNILDGRMQSFVQGDTWIITQVNEFPRRKVVNILLVVGHIGDAIQALQQIHEFAQRIDATMIMAALARDGWEAYKQPGWKCIGRVYTREL